MKKKSFLSLIFSTILMIIGLSSCKKCQVCTYDGYHESVCQDDFNSKTAYKAYIKLLEAYGYDCK